MITSFILDTDDPDKILACCKIVSGFIGRVRRASFGRYVAVISAATPDSLARAWARYLDCRDKLEDAAMTMSVCRDHLERLGHQEAALEIDLMVLAARHASEAGSPASRLDSPIGWDGAAFGAVAPLIPTSGD